MSKQDYKVFLDGSKVVLNYSGSSSFDSLGIDLSDWNGAWLLYFWGDSTPSGQTITIQVSDDNINWFDYKTEAVDVPFDDYFYDDIMPHKYLRVKYTANSYGGNISLKFVQI